MKNNPHPLFHKSLYGVLTATLLALFLLYRAGKDKNKFYQTTGEIVYIGPATGNLGTKDRNKYRYLQLGSHPKTFELFVGKETGDFQPQLEKLDSLTEGDTVTVYYDENKFTKDEDINRLAYFIDRGQEPVFIKGSWEKMLAYFILGLCTFITVLLLYLKKRGRIS